MLQMGTVCVSVMERDSSRALCVIYRSDNAQANARAPAGLVGKPHSSLFVSS